MNNLPFQTRLGFARNSSKVPSAKVYAANPQSTRPNLGPAAMPRLQIGPTALTRPAPPALYGAKLPTPPSPARGAVRSFASGKPAAPPVYRPNLATAPIVQAFAAIPPGAPLVYRPVASQTGGVAPNRALPVAQASPLPFVSQPLVRGVAQSFASGKPAAPPVYRPNLATAPMVQAFAAAPPGAPPVYRPAGSQAGGVAPNRALPGAQACPAKVYVSFMRAPPPAYRLAMAAVAQPLAAPQSVVQLTRRKKKNKHRKGRPRRPRSERPTISVRDDTLLNISFPSTPTVRAYRTEVENFNPRYGHIFEGGQGYVYTPPPDLSKYEGKGKKTPPKHPDPRKYNRLFLKGREHMPLGTYGWIGFGGPKRALEFYDQKSTNPTEIALGNKFKIKSFEVPRHMLDTILEDTVHESEGTNKPHLPANVDRKATNQFKLPTHYVALINRTMIPGSVREEDPVGLKYQFDPPERAIAKPGKNRQKLGGKAARSIEGQIAQGVAEYSYDEHYSDYDDEEYEDADFDQNDYDDPYGDY
jgi:hypothetical protein